MASLLIVYISETEQPDRGLKYVMISEIAPT